MAESVDFIRCFLKGAVERKSYVKLLVGLRAVYAAMESELAHHQEHPIIGRLCFPELWRQTSLEDDLRYFCGERWDSQQDPTPAVLAYVARIRRVSREQPELLIAHAYTRYLGDLSGGQVLKRLARGGMQLPESEGTGFYEFPAIPDPKAFKHDYRQMLDDLPLDETTCDQIVAEANLAFALNMALFKELEGSLLQAIGRAAFNRIVRRRGS